MIKIGNSDYPDNISLNVIRDLKKFHNIKTLFLNELEKLYFNLLISPNEIIKNDYLKLENICLNSRLLNEKELNTMKSKYSKE